MFNDLELGSRALAKGRIRRIHRAIGHRVECLSGLLWITQDGDLRDILLSPGEAFDFDHRGDALVSALDESRYLLLDACVQH